MGKKHLKALSDAERFQLIVNRVDSAPWTGAFGGEGEDLDHVKWIVNKYDRAQGMTAEIMELRKRINDLETFVLVVFSYLKLPHDLYCADSILSKFVHVHNSQPENAPRIETLENGQKEQAPKE